jgi:hypothetical protein
MDSQALDLTDAKLAPGHQRRIVQIGIRLAPDDEDLRALRNCPPQAAVVHAQAGECCGVTDDDAP